MEDLGKVQDWNYPFIQQNSIKRLVTKTKLAKLLGKTSMWSFELFGTPFTLKKLPYNLDHSMDCVQIVLGNLINMTWLPTKESGWDGKAFSLKSWIQIYYNSPNPKHNNHLCSYDQSANVFNIDVFKRNYRVQTLSFFPLITNFNTVQSDNLLHY